MHALPQNFADPAEGFCLKTNPTGRDLKEAFEQGETWEDTFPLRGKDGQYCWFLSRAEPIRDEQGRVVRWFGTNTDVTELRETEAALRASEDQRRVFLAAIEHDLRNPLSTIKGLAQLLEHQAEEGSITRERLRDRLAALVASADRIAAQLDELNLVTRDDQQRPRLSLATVDLVALVRQAAATRQLGSDSHRISVVADADELVGLLDPTRLTRVMDNLLANAVKYSPAGSEAAVEIHKFRRA